MPVLPKPKTYREMLSATQLRRDFFRVLRVVMDLPVTVEFYNHRHIYRMWIEDTGQMVEGQYVLHKRHKAPIVPNALLRGRECPNCHALRFGDICMTRGCTELPSLAKHEYDEFGNILDTQKPPESG